MALSTSPITGKLELTKTERCRRETSSIAGFRIKGEDGNIVATGVTNENRIATFTLQYGKYTYRELQCPGRPTRLMSRIRLWIRKTDRS